MPAGARRKTGLPLTHRSSILVPSIAGFALILLIMLGLSAAGIGLVRDMGKRITTVVDVQNRKTALAGEMHRLQRERHLVLQSLARLDDPFDRDTAIMHFFSLAEPFVRARDQFVAMPLDDDELALWQGIRQDIRAVEKDAEALFERLPTLTSSADIDAATSPTRLRQEVMMGEWERLITLQRDKNVRARAEVLAAEDRARQVAYGMSGAALIISVVMAVAVLRISRRQESNLREEKEKAEFTLDAIADAVLRYDLEGQVCYLNPAARQMLGVDAQEVVGREIGEVVQLFDQGSRQPLVAELLSQAQAGDKVSLPPDARLLTAQGLELEVEGSCRAIRDDSGAARALVLVLRDVTEAREWLRQQLDLWDRDSLTALPGRRYLEDRLGKILRNQRAADLPLTYLQVDLAGVGHLSASEGQEAGDAAVRHAVALLRTCLRETDLVCRIGEHAFGILLTACPAEVSDRVEGDIRAAVARFRVEWRRRDHTLGATLGAVHSPPFEGTVDEILAMAAAESK